jgi:dihydroorotase
MIVIKNGIVLTPEGMVAADVAIEDGRISNIASAIEADAEVVDAGGCFVGPGLVDLHVHTREPGQEWKETIASASQAAVAGGFTAIVAMPNTTPAIDAGHLARFVADRGRQAGLCLVAPSGAISLGRQGEQLAHLDDLWQAGVRIFTDDGETVRDAGLLRNAMEYLVGRGGIVAQHAEDPGLARGGQMHEGSVSARLGMRGLPAAAEEIIIARDLALVKLTGCRYHVQHVSTAGSVELVRAAKEQGLPVTAEVTPHSLTFDHEMVMTMDPDYKMYPPLRTRADIEALRAGLISGVIDAVATDHAPHAVAECEVPFEEAPRGVIGLETALSAVMAAVGPDPELLFERMSIAPAKIAGLDRHGQRLQVGGPANLCVIDPSAEWEVFGFRSMALNSPWKGQTMRGRVVSTVFEGRQVHQMVKS